MTTLIPKIDFKNGETTPVGAINRTINEKAQDIVSVKDFGATGDGTTDDTVAIQAAITYAQTTTGLNVYLPLGTYKVTNTININCDLVGLSGNGAIISAVGLTTSQVLFNITHSSGTVFPAFQTLEIKGLTINSSGNNGICFNVAGLGIDQFAAQIQYDLLKITNFNIAFQYGSYAFSPVFNRCSVSGVNQVFKANSITSVGGHYVWDKCLFTEFGNYSASTPGFDIGGLSDHHFTACDIEAANYTAFTTSGGDAYFDNCHIEMDCGVDGANASLFVVTGGDYGIYSFSQCEMFIWQSTSSFTPFYANSQRLTNFVLANNRVIINTGITLANTTFLGNYYLPFLSNNGITLTSPNNPGSGQNSLLTSATNDSLSNWDFSGAYTIDFTQGGTGTAVSVVADKPYGTANCVDIPPNRYIVTANIPVPDNAQLISFGCWSKQTVAGTSNYSLNFLNANLQVVYTISPSITPSALNTWQLFTLGPTDNDITTKRVKYVQLAFISDGTANTRIAYPFLDFS